MKDNTIYNRQTPPTVVDIMKSLTVVGMGTPSIARAKCNMLFQPDFISNKIAVVIIDVVRCTSTILASFAAGVNSVTITVKGEEDKGTSYSQSSSVAEKIGCELVIGGELGGRPIEGGLIGNSPSEAANCDFLSGKHLHFETSNFGKTFSEVTKLISNYKSIGGDATIFIGSYSNSKAIGEFLRENLYNKIYVMCGGFYDGITLEDEIAGGSIINSLNVDSNTLDDEARVMSLLHTMYNTFDTQFPLLSENSVSKLLAKFDRESDIKTVLDGTGIPLNKWERMKTIIPYVDWIDNVPVIYSKIF